jgi:hypothetical protein
MSLEAQMRGSKREVTLDIPVAGLPDGATHIEVCTFYGAGGINFFNYETEPRGFWASFKTVTITPPDPATGRFGSKSFMMFTSNGFKVFLKETPRYHAPTLAALAAKVATVADRVALLAADGSKEGAAELLKTLREVPVAPAA